MRAQYASHPRQDQKQSPGRGFETAFPSAAAHPRSRASHPVLAYGPRMLTLSLALTLALGQLDGGISAEEASDAGIEDAGTKPFSAAIYGSCPDATDAGLAYRDEALKAWVLPDPRGARQACLLAACEEDRRYRQSPEATVTGQTHAGAVASGLCR